MDENNSVEILGLIVGIIVWILHKLKDKQSYIRLAISRLRNKSIDLLAKLLKI